MAKALSAARSRWGAWEPQEQWAARHREAWIYSRQGMAVYLSSPEWKAKRDRAFLIWRAIGWTLVVGPLAAHFHPNALAGSARVLLAWPVQLLAAFGFGYAVMLRGHSLITHHRLHRVGHHIGYTHVHIVPDDPHFTHCTERWYEIWPVTQTVNRAESFLRRDKPSPGFRRYFRRTLIAVAVCRFWWVGVAFGLSWWHWGLANTLAWLAMAGHRI